MRESRRPRNGRDWRNSSRAMKRNKMGKKILFPILFYFILRFLMRGLFGSDFLGFLGFDGLAGFSFSFAAF